MSTICSCFQCHFVGRDIPRSKTAVLAPVMDLKKNSSKGNEKSNDDIFESKYSFTPDKVDNSLIYRNNNENTSQVKYDIEHIIFCFSALSACSEFPFF